MLGVAALEGMQKRMNGKIMNSLHQYLVLKTIPIHHSFLETG